MVEFNENYSFSNKILNFVPEGPTIIGVLTRCIHMEGTSIVCSRSFEHRPVNGESF